MTLSLLYSPPLIDITHSVNKVSVWNGLNIHLRHSQEQEWWLWTAKYKTLNGVGDSVSWQIISIKNLISFVIFLMVNISDDVFKTLKWRLVKLLLYCMFGYYSGLGCNLFFCGSKKFSTMALTKSSSSFFRCFTSLLWREVRLV